ncbi:MAG: thymidine phosphorylase [Tranquillimonas sp.]
MEARTIIAGLRDGRRPDAAALDWFARGLADGSVSDAQAGAFAMAACLNGLGADGRVALTRAMRDSGDVLHWDLPGPVVDKHSTGGVGDCVSLILAPALAAAGCYVPMISGRGLGHTGGTLDKLEAIPGLDVELPEDRFRSVVAGTGCAIVAASANLAPADRRLYAIRDVTGTVESVDLITASILSKKLAEGAEALILDVKTGSGAFMKDEAAAAELARALVDTANGAGCRCGALLTDMSQPLAPALGNALEVEASLRVLTGEDGGQGGGRLAEVTLALGGALLVLAGHAASRGEGADRLAGLLSSGAAAEAFARMVAAQGGPADLVENWRRHLPRAPVRRTVRAGQAGKVAAIDGMALGMTVVRLGGGRMVGGDRIDPAVGLSEVAPLGLDCGPDSVLAVIHAADAGAADQAEAEIRAAILLSDTAPPLPTTIRQELHP